MEIKIPKQIKIGTHTYEIKLDPHIFSDAKEYGEINYRTQEIKVWSESPLTLKNQTLLHEVIHLAQHIYRVEISDADIDRVAETIGEFLFNNLGLEFSWGDIC